MKNRKKIGEMLVETGAIGEMQLSAALGEQSRWGGKLGSIILRRGFAREERIASALGRQAGQKSVSIRETKIPAEVLKRIRPEIARKYHVIPIGADSRNVEVAMPDPDDLKTLDELGFVLGARIHPLIAVESAIKEGLDRYYGEGEKEPMPKISFEGPSPRFPGEEPKIRKNGNGAAMTAENKVNALITILLDKGLITEADLSDKMR